MEAQIDSAAGFIDKSFDSEFVPALSDFIRIPNLSKEFDPEWETNGLLEKAAKFCIDFVDRIKLQGLKMELIKHPGRSPIIFGEVPATCPESKRSTLLYGHFDKQPHFEGWDEGLHPTKPVIKNGRLYGRGGADDGYAFFSSVLAIKALQENGLKHSRIILLFEGDEESMSGDLEYYFLQLKEKIGKLDLLVCLDSGCMDYKHMMVTTTLRGVVSVTVKVQTAIYGIHSGDASGVVPDSFRVLRNLIDRIENSTTGAIIDDFQVTIPPQSYQEAFNIKDIAWEGLLSKFPKHPETNFTSKDPLTAYLNRAWKAQLTVTGSDGFPPTHCAGNVIRPQTTMKLSLRIPPTLDPIKAKDRLVEILTTNPPYGAKVTIPNATSGSGWLCQPYPEDLRKIIEDSSRFGFNRECLYGSEGGSIPFVGDLQRLCPETNLFVVGVLGPDNGAHGPNEMLDLEYTKKMQKALVYILANYL